MIFINGEKMKLKMIARNVEELAHYDKIKVKNGT
jgi:hypothetical protein